MMTPPPVGLHVPRRPLGAGDDPEQVDPQDRREVLEVIGQEPLERAADPGVVEHDVQSAEVLDGVVHDRLDLVEVAHVGLVEGRAVAERLGHHAAPSRRRCRRSRPARPRRPTSSPSPDRCRRRPPVTMATLPASSSVTIEKLPPRSNPAQRCLTGPAASSCPSAGVEDLGGRGDAEDALGVAHDGHGHAVADPVVVVGVAGEGHPLADRRPAQVTGDVGVDRTSPGWDRGRTPMRLAMSRGSDRQRGRPGPARRPRPAPAGGTTRRAPRRSGSAVRRISAPRRRNSADARPELELAARVVRLRQRGGRVPVGGGDRHARAGRPRRGPGCAGPGLGWSPSLPPSSSGRRAGSSCPPAGSRWRRGEARPRAPGARCRRSGGSCSSAPASARPRGRGPSRASTAPPALGLGSQALPVHGRADEAVAVPLVERRRLVIGHRRSIPDASAPP